MQQPLESSKSKSLCNPVIEIIEKTGSDHDWNANVLVNSEYSGRLVFYRSMQNGCYTIRLYRLVPSDGPRLKRGPLVAEAEFHSQPSQCYIEYWAVRAMRRAMMESKIHRENQ